MRHILSILVENEAGALSRISGLFSARGYNIESLTVAPTEDERFSRVSIVVDVESAPLVRSSYHARDQVPGAELKSAVERWVNDILAGSPVRIAVWLLPLRVAS